MTKVKKKSANQSDIPCVPSMQFNELFLSSCLLARASRNWRIGSMISRFFGYNFFEGSVLTSFLKIIQDSWTFHLPWLRRFLDDFWTMFGKKFGSMFLTIVWMTVKMIILTLYPNIFLIFFHNFWQLLGIFFWLFWGYIHV